MASGFFLGGAAEGMSDAEKQRLARETLATEAGLRERGLGLQARGLDISERTANANIGINERAQTLAEKNAGRVAGQQGLERVDKQIAETMATVSETVKQGLAAGRDPATIQNAVAPLLDSVKRLAPFAKRDPATFDAQVNALLAGPTMVEAATVKGTAEGTAQAAKAKALAAAGVVDENAGFKDKAQKVQAENSLRDDFMKESKDFLTVRNFKTRMDSAEATGAGDLTMVFSFMKMLDPPSVVREGEQATASNAAGVPEAIRGMYNQIVGGGKLSPEARKQLKSQSGKIFEGATENYQQTKSLFSGIAKRQGLAVDNVIVDMAGPNTGISPGGFKFKVVK